MLGLSDVTQTSIVQSLTARELPLAVEGYMVYCSLPLTTTETEIFPLCKRAFAKSFVEVPPKRHDIADRGWNPLKRALFFNTEVIKTNIVDMVENDTVTASPRNIFTGDQSVISSMTSTSSVASTSSATHRRVAQTLKLKYGSAGKIITDLIQYAMKEEGVIKNLKKRFAECKMLQGEIF